MGGVAACFAFAPFFILHSAASLSAGIAVCLCALFLMAIEALFGLYWRRFSVRYAGTVRYVWIRRHTPPEEVREGIVKAFARATVVPVASSIRGLRPVSGPLYPISLVARFPSCVPVETVDVVADSSPPDIVQPPAAVPLSALTAGDVDAREQLYRAVLRHGYAVITVGTEFASTITRVFEAGTEFFQHLSGWKRLYRQKRFEAESICWGYFSEGRREYFEVRSRSLPPWPPIAGFEECHMDAFEQLGAIAGLAYQVLCEYAPGMDAAAAMRLLDSQWQPAVSSSCMRLHRYANSALLSRAFGYAGIHTDLGLVTAAPRATVAGLYLLDQVMNDWLLAENLLQPDQVIVFAGSLLGQMSHGYFRPLLHRAVYPAVSPRLSLVYFLRGFPLAPLPGVDTEPDEEDATQKNRSRTVHDHMAETRRNRIAARVPSSVVRWTYCRLQSWVASRFPAYEYMVSPELRI
eukprot:TRINITY_DN71742_c0_g1_i1.p1 TRINITY_DN71742_c0_g1~~TRINITY_DN71742_c0_g1_i1.p1  ORF type:complete len:478 (+),score=40.84 TRINITY_DN71742_c0_g1_i1:46-1434(+)